MEKIDVVATSKERIKKIGQLVVNTGSRPNIDIFREIQYSLHASAECVEGVSERTSLFKKESSSHTRKDFYAIWKKNFISWYLGVMNGHFHSFL